MCELHLDGNHFFTLRIGGANCCIYLPRSPSGTVRANMNTVV